MAVTLQVGDILSLRAHTFYQNQAGVNQFAYKVTTVVGAPSLQGILDTWSADAAAAYLQWLTPGAEYEGLKGMVIRGTTKYLPTISTAGRGTSVVVGIPHPKQISGLTTKVTELAGRANRGRVYWPFPWTDTNDNSGAPTPLQVTLMTTLAGTFLAVTTKAAGVDSATFQPVLLHKVPTLAPTPILTSLTAAKWATQRRRGDYGRPNVQFS